MTLSIHFNGKSQIKRRPVVETESMGAQSFSRIFCSVSFRKCQSQLGPAVAKSIIIAAPRLIRRGMNI